MVQIYSACVPPRPLDRYVRYAKRKLGIGQSLEVIRDIPRNDALRHRDFPITTTIVLGNSCNLHCAHCLAPDTIVGGDYQPISEYKKGDGCLGVTGKTAIQRTFKHIYAGPIVKIKCVGSLPLNITPEHPVLVVSRGHDRCLTTEHWKYPKDLRPIRKHKEGDFLVIPRVEGWISKAKFDLSHFTNAHGRKATQNRGFLLALPINERTAWMLGMYVAEGSANPKNPQVRFSLGKHESKLAQRLRQIIRDLGYKPRSTLTPTTLVINFSSHLLARALSSVCGSHANTKRIPEFILYHKNKNILKEFIDGYMAGDGCFASKMQRYHANTTSIYLALQLQLALGRMGHFASLRKQIRPKTAIIQNRIISQSPRFELSYYPNGSRKAIVRGHDILVPVKSISMQHYEGTVGNLETSDETYVANNLVVHNCGFHGPSAPTYFSRPEEMSWDTIDKLTAELPLHHAHAKFGAFEEPLLYYSKFEALASRFIRRGVGVHLTTNGTLIRPDRMGLLRNLRTLYISLDAATSSTYKRIRGEDYNRVVSNVLDLASCFSGVKMGVSFIRQLEALGEEQTFVDYWLPKVDMVIMYALSVFNRYGYMIDKPFLESPKHRVVCSSPWLETYIMPDGSVSLCCQTVMMADREDMPIMGNLKEQSLNEIWNGPKYERHRAALIDEDWDTARICQNCPLWAASYYTIEYQNGLKITRNATTKVIERTVRG